MASSTVTIRSEADLWDRVIQPQRSDLSPGAARSILNLSFDPHDGERRHKLALKAQEATELETSRRLGRPLDLMQGGPPAA